MIQKLQSPPGNSLWPLAIFDLPTYLVLPYNVQFLGLLWTPLPTLISDVINGRSLGGRQTFPKKVRTFVKGKGRQIPLRCRLRHNYKGLFSCFLSPRYLNIKNIDISHKQPWVLFQFDFFVRVLIRMEQFYPYEKVQSLKTVTFYAYCPLLTLVLDEFKNK